jgi:GT2 family glycosyltransferase
MSFGSDLRAALIVTTYNWPEALALNLQSVLRQTATPYEVIVADDGSKPKTADVVTNLLGPANLRWCHVRHADTKVRQSRIKNLATKHSQAPYLIFVDHDVVLHPDFVTDHLAEAEEGIFLQGKRALVPENEASRIVAEGRFRAPSLFTRGLGNRKNTLRFPALGRLLTRSKGFSTALRGCNLSMFRSDFLTVDGFDETYDRTWGREDSDICYRLFHAGVRVKHLWFAALQYHLYHGITENWDRERLDGELAQTLQDQRVKALRGFSRLSSEGGIIAASPAF